MRINAMTCSKTLRVVALLTVLAAAAACSSGNETPVQQETAAPLTALSATDAQRFTGIAWEQDKTQPTGTVLRIRATAGGCRKLAGATVTAAADKVTVGVYASDAGDCTGPDKVTVVALVQLPDALGNRTLAHEPV
jgi:hypothetical protein